MRQDALNVERLVVLLRRVVVQLILVIVLLTCSEARSCEDETTRGCPRGRGGTL